MGFLTAKNLGVQTGSQIRKEDNMQEVRTIVTEENTELIVIDTKRRRLDQDNGLENGPLDSLAQQEKDVHMTTLEGGEQSPKNVLLAGAAVQARQSS